MRHSNALGISLANDGDGGSQYLLEGHGNEAALFVEPLGEGLGELDGLAGSSLGDGDGEVIDGDVLLGCADDVDLQFLVQAFPGPRGQGIITFSPEGNTPSYTVPFSRNMIQYVNTELITV